MDFRQNNQDETRANRFQHYDKIINLRKRAELERKWREGATQDPQAQAEASTTQPSETEVKSRTWEDIGKTITKRGLSLTSHLPEAMVPEPILKMQDTLKQHRGEKNAAAKEFCEAALALDAVWDYKDDLKKVLTTYGKLSEYQRRLNTPPKNYDALSMLELRAIRSDIEEAQEMTEVMMSPDKKFPEAAKEDVKQFLIDTMKKLVEAEGKMSTAAQHPSVDLGRHGEPVQKSMEKLRNIFQASVNDTYLNAMIPPSLGDRRPSLKEMNDDFDTLLKGLNGIMEQRREGVPGCLERLHKSCETISNLLESKNPDVAGDFSPTFLDKVRKNLNAAKDSKYIKEAIFLPAVVNGVVMNGPKDLIELTESLVKIEQKMTTDPKLLRDVSQFEEKWNENQSKKRSQEIKGEVEALQRKLDGGNQGPPYTSEQFKEWNDLIERCKCEMPAIGITIKDYEKEYISLDTNYKKIQNDLSDARKIEIDEKTKKIRESLDEYKMIDKQLDQLKEKIQQKEQKQLNEAKKEWEDLKKKRETFKNMRTEHDKTEKLFKKWLDSQNRSTGEGSPSDTFLKWCEEAKVEEWKKMVEGMEEKSRNDVKERLVKLTNHPQADQVLGDEIQYVQKMQEYAQDDKNFEEVQEKYVPLRDKINMQNDILMYEVLKKELVDGFFDQHEKTVNQIEYTIALKTFNEWLSGHFQLLLEEAQEAVGGDDALSDDLKERLGDGTRAFVKKVSTVQKLIDLQEVVTLASKERSGAEKYQDQLREAQSLLEAGKQGKKMATDLQDGTNDLKKVLDDISKELVGVNDLEDLSRVVKELEEMLDDEKYGHSENNIKKLKKDTEQLKGVLKKIKNGEAVTGDLSASLLPLYDHYCDSFCMLDADINNDFGRISDYLQEKKEEKDADDQKLEASLDSWNELAQESQKYRSRKSLIMKELMEQRTKLVDRRAQLIKESGESKYTQLKEEEIAKIKIDECNKRQEINNAIASVTDLKSRWTKELESYKEEVGNIEKEVGNIEEAKTFQRFSLWRSQNQGRNQAICWQSREYLDNADVTIEGLSKHLEQLNNVEANFNTQWEKVTALKKKMRRCSDEVDEESETLEVVSRDVMKKIRKLKLAFIEFGKQEALKEMSGLRTELDQNDRRDEALPNNIPLEAQIELAVAKGMQALARGRPEYSQYTTLENFVEEYGKHTIIEWKAESSTVEIGTVRENRYMYLIRIRIKEGEMIMRNIRRWNKDTLPWSDVKRGYSELLPVLLSNKEYREKCKTVDIPNEADIKSKLKRLDEYVMIHYKANRRTQSVRKLCKELFKTETFVNDENLEEYEGYIAMLGTPNCRGRFFRLSQDERLIRQNLDIAKIEGDGSDIKMTIGKK